MIKGRLSKVGKTAKLINRDFLEVHKLGQKFDAVIFNASFHHCSDHQQMIKNLDQLIAPGGKVYFCNEPITDGQPYPWGLRLDGESIFHIRLHGWLELGFQETYFRDLMTKNGWKTVAIPSPLGSQVFCCTKA
ncbi:MAG: class I SAM-dependent methyltransferase [Bdellovibrionales bacterium]|nr:class I SAM-dependent methyltransferase [Bdellovibrionales bacterium]